jgi:hypothetical protein
MGAGPGDVFVHRNVGNLVNNTDLNAMSVIDYAVRMLNVKHIVVCGHYGCGGIKAAMTPQDLGILNPWLRNIRDVYRLHHTELDAIPGRAGAVRPLGGTERAGTVRERDQARHCAAALCPARLAGGAWLGVRHGHWPIEGPGDRLPHAAAGDPGHIQPHGPTPVRREGQNLAVAGSLQRTWPGRCRAPRPGSIRPCWRKLSCGHRQHGPVRLFLAARAAWPECAPQPRDHEIPCPTSRTDRASHPLRPGCRTALRAPWPNTFSHAVGGPSARNAPTAALTAPIRSCSAVRASTR